MSHRSQGKRSGTRDYEQAALSGGRCDCGKIRFLSKTDAKRTIRRMKGRKGPRMHAYACGEFWHIGHVPKDLKTGYATRADVEARRFK